jgi:Arc/MetJ-type ribon-helix-helix transcriptional regulator
MTQQPGEDAVQVSIPASLADRVRRRLPKSEFKSVDEYVAFVVEQVLTEVEGNEAAKEAPKEAFSKEDQASVEQRLRDLGYM